MVFDVGLDDGGAMVVAGRNHDKSTFVARIFPAREAIAAAFAANFQEWLDGVFDRGEVAYVRALLPQPEGKVIVAGGVAKRVGLKTLGPFVVRLNADGTIDRGSRKYGGAPRDGTQFDWVINSLGCLPDGTIVAAGTFMEPDAPLSLGSVLFQIQKVYLSAKPSVTSG